MVKTALPNADKAAILLYSLPPEDAETVLELLGPDHGPRLRELMEWYAGSPNLDELIQQVVAEFTALTSGGTLGLPGHPSAAEKRAAYSNLLQQRLEGEDADFESGGSGDGKGNGDGDGDHELSAEEAEDPANVLQTVDTGRLVAALKAEHPRVIAIVLQSLKSDGEHGSRVPDVLGRLPPEKRQEAFVQMAAGMPDNDALVSRILKAVVEKSASEDAKVEKSDDEQFQLLADILHSVDREDRKEMMEALESFSSNVADKVDALLFNFEDLAKIADRTVQKILSEVDQKSLAMALQGCNDETMEAVLNNMSERVRGMVQEEMDFMRDSPPEKIQEARRGVIDVIRRYDKEGTLVWK